MSLRFYKLNSKAIAMSFDKLSKRFNLKPYLPVLRGHSKRLQRLLGVKNEGSKK